MISTHISKGWVLSYTHNNACHFAQWPSNEHFQIKFLEIFSNFRLFSVTSLYTMPDVRFCPSCLICCWITRSPAASKFSSFSMTWTSSFWLWLKVVAMVMRRCLITGVWIRSGIVLLFGAGSESRYRGNEVTPGLQLQCYRKCPWSTPM